MNITTSITGIDEVIAEVEDTVARRTAKIARDIFRNLVDRTPVLTGRARANWNITTTGINPELPEGFYGRPKLPKIPTKFNTLFINNPLDYVKGLNEGSSRKAPAAFIETAVADAVGKSGNSEKTRILE